MVYEPIWTIRQFAARDFAAFQWKLRHHSILPVAIDFALDHVSVC